MTCQRSLAGTARLAPQEQIPVIEKMLATDRDFLAQPPEAMRREDPPRSDIHWQVVDKFNQSVSLAKRRLDELRAEISEDWSFLPRFARADERARQQLLQDEQRR